ncbi:MAG: PAS domain-containing sensor histidine kinase [Ignavibacteria bacterium]|nr:PAS domain-containing sensor histidine kinase [Ignavibacteria bacterium]
MKAAELDIVKNFSDFFNSSNDLVFLIDKENNIIDLNEFAADYFFEAKVNLLSRNLTSLFDIQRDENEDLVIFSPLNSIDQTPLPGKIFHLKDGNKLLILDEVIDRKILFQRLLNHSPFGFIIFNKSGTIFYHNDQFIDLWGIKKEDLKDYNVFKDKLLESSGKLKLIQDAFDANNPVYTNGYFDQLMEKGRGYQIWLETLILPIFDSLGNIEKVALIHTDISDIKLAREEVKIAIDRADEANRLKNTFLANLSHEIRTPLNSIIGFSELITEFAKENLSDADIELLGTFKRGIGRLHKTLTQIMEISQIDSGSYPVALKPINIVESISGIIKSKQKEIEKKKLEILTSFEKNTIEVLADETALNNVLLNLIENAIKFTIRGSISIETKANVSNTILFCSIKDTGIGISPEYLDHIFEPFSQEKIGYSRPFEGNGLGLALTKRFLELMNGSITVESTKGVGTNFTFSISIH